MHLPVGNSGDEEGEETIEAGCEALISWRPLGGNSGDDDEGLEVMGPGG